MLNWRGVMVFALSLLGFLLSFDSADAFLAYVSNEKGNSISVIDTEKMETITTIKTGQRPRGIEVSRDGKFVFVALGDDDVIQVFDTRTRNDAGGLPSGADPEQFPLDPAGNLLTVPKKNDPMETAIVLGNRPPLGQKLVGSHPQGRPVAPHSKALIVH